ncbi:Bro-N domain-containing protein [Acinetobacter venetianus]|jgi:prophage antirepressor-like protein|uniref:BRO-N domain-containing protein n=1 Tax=Acinetobacter venetianus TaxID=52133 RepID=UPI00384B63CB
MNTVTHFDFKSSSVRIVLDGKGEPLFCLADVCKALVMQRANPSRFSLNPKGVHSLCTPTTSGNQFITFISEENLYRIVFRSTKPEALNFQNWVFSEVLPSLRKTGTYSARQTAFDELNRLCFQEKVSKEKGTFHSHGMHRRKHEKRLNTLRINTCKANIQMTFEEVHHE